MKQESFFYGAAGLGLGILSARSLRRRTARKPPPLEAVEFVDLQRYAGRWFEIARYPTRFEAQCAKNTTAEYTLQRRRLFVENRCTRPKGGSDVVTGVAKAAQPQSGKLKVRFGTFAPSADYWIIDLDENYRWAVVGEPKRRYLWILSRTPSLDDEIYERLRARLAQVHGYDPQRLQRTAQDGG